MYSVVNSRCMVNAVTKQRNTERGIDVHKVVPEITTTWCVYLYMKWNCWSQSFERMKIKISVRGNTWRDFVASDLDTDFTPSEMLTLISIPPNVILPFFSEHWVWIKLWNMAAPLKWDGSYFLLCKTECSFKDNSSKNKDRRTKIQPKVILLILSIFFLLISNVSPIFWKGKICAYTSIKIYFSNLVVRKCCHNTTTNTNDNAFLYCLWCASYCTNIMSSHINVTGLVSPFAR